MHKSSMLRMKWIFDNFITPYSNKKKHVKVLDVGSYNVNGCYKEYFMDGIYHYVGLDIEKGPNVDFIPQNIYKWTELGDESFDVVISGQALEHIEFFWQTAAEMTRVLKKEGLLCLLVPRGFALHRYPIDCYRFDTDGVVALARYCNLTPLHASTNLQPIDSTEEWSAAGDEDTMLVAQKSTDWQGLIDYSTYKLELPDVEKLSSGLVLPNKTYQAERAEQAWEVCKESIESIKQVEMGAIKKIRHAESSAIESIRQMEMDAVEVAKSAKDVLNGKEMKDALCLSEQKNFVYSAIKMSYKKYSFLSRITFGSIRKRYKLKKSKYRSLLDLFC